MKKIIFILGTGRSGTHLIGRTIASHPEIEGHIENPDHFMLSAYIAAYQDLVPGFATYPFKRLLLHKYKRLLNTTRYNFILDKTHPNIWLAEFLYKHLPNAVFIGVVRDVLPTVASMMQHEDVMGWYKKIPQGRPNRFLGISKDNLSQFRNLSTLEKCVYRWQSHKNELERLQSTLSPSRMMIVNYEKFMNTPDEHLQELAAFIKIENRYNFEKLKKESLEKWKSTLSNSEIESVYGILQNT